MSRRVSRDPAVSPVLLSSNSRLARVGPSSRSAAEYSCGCKAKISCNLDAVRKQKRLAAYSTQFRRLLCARNSSCD